MVAESESTLPRSEATQFHGLIFIVGPTAVGKTNLSLFLSEKLPASVLNCDSISMFKGLNIGSAKPSFKYLKKKECFFLFDEWTPPFVCTAGEFRKKALAVLKAQLPKQIVLAVGGSGFYIQALEKGMYPVKKVDSKIKKKLQKLQKEKGAQYLYSLLQSIDPEYAKKISPNDNYRIFRGLCLAFSEKKTPSVIQSSFREKNLPYSTHKLGLYLPKEVLLERVKARTDQMLRAGLVEEVESLLKQGFENWPLMKSVGYGECMLFLKNQLSEEELKSRIITRTMQLAKKQMSWFKRDQSIKWYVATTPPETLYGELKKQYL